MAGCLNPVRLMSFDVPCGKCYNCLQRYSREWSVRCMDELAANGGKGIFCTLTYAETNGDLCRRDLQLFLKRLRKKIAPQKVRYFACGEYGGKGNRPHYHIMLFGFVPDDLKEVSRKGDNVYYESKFIAETWGLGFVSIGNITIKSAKYCAKYLQKLDKRPHNVKPFTAMSLKPGIGYLNVTPDDILREKRYIDGKAYSLPRYYVRRLEVDGFNVDMLKLHRQQIVEALTPERCPEYYAKLRKENERLIREMNRKLVKKNT